MGASILFISNNARSTYRVWANLIKAMQKAGHKVTIAIPSASSSQDIHKLQALCLHHSQELSCIPYPLKARSILPWEQWQSICALRRIFAKHQPDVIFVSTIKPIIYSSFALQSLGKNYTKKSRMYACITGRGYVFEESHALAKKMLCSGVYPLYRHALRRAHKVFFQNTKDVDFFANNKMLCNTQNAIVTPASGVDLKYFSPQAYPEKPTFLLMARLLVSKGIDDFVKAAKILKNKYPYAQFLLLGPQEKGVGAYAIRTLEEQQQAGYIQYLGEADDVRPIIAQASVMVLPSWGEGLPAAILEGMAMGRAAVVTDVAGCADLVQEGKNGFLVPPRQAISLANAMENFIQKPELILSMGKAGRKIAEQYFDTHALANEMLAHMDLK